MAYTYKPYEESDAVKQAKANLEAQLAKKPAEYTSNWQAQLNETLNQIQNRKPFTYDLNADALYQQYKDMYTTQGKMAMMDTMGQAAALTGGYGSSYGQSVGQQAYQGYLQGLNDKVPELYSLALDQYNQKGNDLLNMYGLLSDQEAQDYGRWQDLQAAYESERNYLANLYNAERDYDYGMHADAQKYAYQAERDAAADAQWQAQFDEAIRQYNQDYAFNERKYNEAMSASYGGGGNDTPTVYDTHGYSTEQIIDLQRQAGIAQDGIWGPDTQRAYDAGIRPDVRTPGMLKSGEALNLAIKNAQENYGGTYEGQVHELAVLFNQGRITEAQLKQLASAITNPSK